MVAGGAKHNTRTARGTAGDDPIRLKCTHVCFARGQEETIEQRSVWASVWAEAHAADRACGSHAEPTKQWGEKTIRMENVPCRRRCWPKGPTSPAHGWQSIWDDRANRSLTYCECVLWTRKDVSTRRTNENCNFEEGTPADAPADHTSAPFLMMFPSRFQICSNACAYYPSVSLICLVNCKLYHAFSRLLVVCVVFNPQEHARCCHGMWGPRRERVWQSTQQHAPTCTPSHHHPCLNLKMPNHFPNRPDVRVPGIR